MNCICKLRIASETCAPSEHENFLKLKKLHRFNSVEHRRPFNSLLQEFLNCKFNSAHSQLVKDPKIQEELGSAQVEACCCFSVSIPTLIFALSNRVVGQGLKYKKSSTTISFPAKSISRLVASLPSHSASWWPACRVSQHNGGQPAESLSRLVTGSAYQLAGNPLPNPLRRLATSPPGNIRG
ncbi:hypothetical protein PCASD_08037 [Puccinia coronata f. sp. avenae]|uniref:Uncharacterized protein n=1 Tax=Puccinia coronata f. sp. avenae TaxID=200324 RepID=A0A2N5RV92_9BASI|nr:hypothetical protein PCASD_26171 [Puccinia coronata f. sp. avenae]PLW39456.1 hypothetical protein PCASD_08037 [Puccinia coronata f. sp. avenae]